MDIVIMYNPKLNRIALAYKDSYTVTSLILDGCFYVGDL